MLYHVAYKRSRCSFTLIGLTQCWSSIVYFIHHLGFLNEDFGSFDTSKVWVFEDILFSISIGLYTMQAFSYTFKLILVLIRSRMVLIPIITQVYKDSLTLRYPPPNINLWLVLQFWYPRVSSLISLSMFNYWYQSFTYMLIQHWSQLLKTQNGSHNFKWIDLPKNKNKRS